MTIENFFSIADKQELNFIVPANAPDISCFRASGSNKNIRLPTVVGFFGPNASGKTTVLRAIVSCISFILHSFNQDEQINFFFQPYRNKNWWGKPTKISLEFDGQLSTEAPINKLHYELHIAHETNQFNKKRVIYEALSYAPKGKSKFLFKRKEQEFSFADEFGGLKTKDPRIQSIRSDASVISTLAKFNHSISIYLNQLLSSWHTNIFGFRKNTLNKNQWLKIYENDTSCLERLNREIRRFDVGLESMTIDQSAQGSFARFKHSGLDEDILVEEESAGTESFIEIFPRLHYVLETGGIAIIDELDSELHPILLPEIFCWFTNNERNKFGAQLLFTAHNAVLLDELEKEQIYFTEKLSGQSSCVYSAKDIKGLRRDPSLMKKYLSGELGSIPHIG